MEYRRYANPPESEEYNVCTISEKCKRVHTMAQRTSPGTQFGELLIGNYDLLEREKDVPAQMSISELMGQPEDTTQLLKERIIPCKPTCVLCGKNRLGDGDPEHISLYPGGSTTDYSR